MFFIVLFRNLGKMIVNLVFELGNLEVFLVCEKLCNEKLLKKVSIIFVSYYYWKKLAFKF